MAVLFYGAFIHLRHTVPGGKFGEIIVCVLGISGALLDLALSFLPPSQITTGSPVVYVVIIAVGVAVFVALPLVVYGLRKPSWRNPQAHFYPFDRQIEGRRPNQVSRWAPGYVPTEEEVEAAESDAIATHGQRASKSQSK